MKLRTALKILSAVGGHGESRYSQFQIDRARARADRTRTARDSERSLREMMAALGLDGRAKLLERLGHPGAAFGLLMRDGRPPETLP